MADTQPAAISQQLERTVAALQQHNFIPLPVASKEEALEEIKRRIPAGASVMNGASVSLQEIGYVDYLKEGRHSWHNLHEAILAETDKAKQSLLRRQSVVSDFYLGSVHALTETGELVIASNSGSQLSHLAFTSPNIILVVGNQKIVPDLASAMRRLEETILPQEDERMRKAYGMGTLHSKTLILHKESPTSGRKIYLILVNEPLGF